MNRLLLALFLVFGLATSLGAAPATPSLYEIEIIVFENRLPGLEGGELWTRTQEKPDATEKEQPILAAANPSPDSPLSGMKAALASSGRHHVLAHLRWQQNAEAKSVSKPVKIASPGGELDGSLRFYLSRFLVVELNLALREAQSGVFSGLSPETAATVFRLSESRRIKVSDTHYFDHPKFGALVKVSPAR